MNFIKKIWEGEEKADFVVLLHKEQVPGSHKGWWLPGVWVRQGLWGWQDMAALPGSRAVGGKWGSFSPRHQVLP